MRRPKSHGVRPLGRRLRLFKSHSVRLKHASQRQIAFLLLGGTLLLYSAAGFGLYEFFTFVF